MAKRKSKVNAVGLFVQTQFGFKNLSLAQDEFPSAD